MATEPPNVVARGIAPNLSVPPQPGAERDLQGLFIAENSEEIWDEILCIVRSVLPSHSRGEETIAQDIFLHLMALQNFDGFSVKNFTNTEIRQSVLALLREKLRDKL